MNRYRDEAQAAWERRVFYLLAIAALIILGVTCP